MFRRIGWQVLLVGVGFLVAAVILMYMATTYTTEFRPAPGGNVCRERWGLPLSRSTPSSATTVTPTATLCRWSSADWTPPCDERRG